MSGNKQLVVEQFWLVIYQQTKNSLIKSHVTQILF